MKNLNKYIIPLACTLLTNTSHAEDNPTSKYSPLEMTTVTIRKTDSYPYGELKTCPECQLRLLPFTPNSRIYVNGQEIDNHQLLDKQVFIGTVFIDSSPIDAISEIVDKQLGDQQ